MNSSKVATREASCSMQLKVILTGETKNSAKHLTECDIVLNEYAWTGLGLNTGQLV